MHVQQNRYAIHSIMYGFTLHRGFSNDGEGPSEVLKGYVLLSKLGLDDGATQFLFLEHLNELDFLLSTFAKPLLV